MKNYWTWALLGLCSTAVAKPNIQAAHAMQRLFPGMGYENMIHEAAAPKAAKVQRRAPVRRRAEQSRFFNNATQKFVVDGKGIPDVDFDIGPSFAGQLPISDKPNERDHLYFWFFPTDNEEQRDSNEIVIWLNGGPGCSSLLGLLQENGPFLWNPGTEKPVSNPWSWHKLTNVVWVEQPVTVGFSQGEASITNEDELGEQFLGFWKSFVDAFCMRGFKVYVAAESYGGYYGPYISSHMVDKKDKNYYDIQGLIVYDGVFFDDSIQSNVVAESTLEQLSTIMPIGDAARQGIHNISESCGFNAWNEKYLVYPPSGPAPNAPPGTKDLGNGTRVPEGECNYLHYYVTSNMSVINPCFDIYNLLNHCPQVSNVIPIDTEAGIEPYFNRPDVKKAINAPLNVNWTACVNGVFTSPNELDLSNPSGVYALPHVIDSTQNVIIAQGAVDFILPLNGVLLGIQNMTWGGQLGFQKAPSDPLYVPSYGIDYDDEDQTDYYAKALPAGWGVQGTTHTERGLTLAVMSLSGHMGPASAPAASFRQLEKLLGRVASLSDTSPFTLPELRNISQPEEPLGNGTVKIPCTKRGCP
ncbi:hypothetical protein CDD81_646 [Ophiocordyceps australis]|uniref:Carboxypeptidase n=1 Tax=Ophiocordyceps australis TaxID=1399860 RepID=A0A2C5XG12_9HYPO|nr:hypothetical protein CDD81_646 [Ophiocordyceps australis]